MAKFASWVQRPWSPPKKLEIGFSFFNMSWQLRTMRDWCHSNGFPVQPAIALGQKTGAWGKLREGTCKAQLSRCWVSLPVLLLLFALPLFQTFQKWGAFTMQTSAPVRGTWHWPGLPRTLLGAWNIPTLHAYLITDFYPECTILWDWTFLQKQKALEKREYLVSQMPTLFSLTLVEIIYSQSLCEVWTETQIHKVFLLWRTNPTISSALPVPPLPRRMLQANPVCKKTILFYGKWSKIRFQKKEKALQPFPWCNYPMWDLAGVMEWMNEWSSKANISRSSYSIISSL